MRQFANIAVLIGSLQATSKLTTQEIYNLRVAAQDRIISNLLEAIPENSFDNKFKNNQYSYHNDQNSDKKWDLQQDLTVIP